MRKKLVIIVLFAVSVFAEMDTVVLQNGLNGYDGERDTWIEWRMEDNYPFGGTSLVISTDKDYYAPTYSVVIVANRSNYF